VERRLIAAQLFRGTASEPNGRLRGADLEVHHTRVKDGRDGDVVHVGGEEHLPRSPSRVSERSCDLTASAGGGTRRGVWARPASPRHWRSVWEECAWFTLFWLLVLTLGLRYARGVWSRRMGRTSLGSVLWSKPATLASQLRYSLVAPRRRV
jgi:hypothetical protein